MRRAAFETLRAARHSQNGRKHLITKPFSSTPTSLIRRPRVGSLSYLQGQQLSPLQSSMQLRSLAIFVISSLVASGAWFAYKDSPGGKGLRFNTTTAFTSSIPSSLPSLATPSSSRTSFIASSASDFPEESAESVRRALVVQNDQFFTGDLPDDQPVSKEVDGSGRLVLEMLTPEQATQKLRRNQQSYSVGRGHGVVRYDLVQLASNSPIEDDHVEKIVSVPDSTLHSEDGSNGSDWMFWGVFDGHRYVTVQRVAGFY